MKCDEKTGVGQSTSSLYSLLLRGAKLSDLMAFIAASCASGCDENSGNPNDPEAVRETERCEAAAELPTRRAPLCAVTSRALDAAACG